MSESKFSVLAGVELVGVLGWVGLGWVEVYVKGVQWLRNAWWRWRRMGRGGWGSVEQV